MKKIRSQKQFDDDEEGNMENELPDEGSVH
jgi:hypothetical protein